MKRLAFRKNLGVRLMGGLAAGTLALAALGTSAATSVTPPPPGAPMPARSHSPPLAELVKLVNAKVDVGIIKAWIKSYPSPFQPTADEIIALEQNGVPDELLTVMVQHDGELRARVATQMPPYPQVPPQYPGTYPTPDQTQVQPQYPDYGYDAPTVDYDYPYYGYGYPYYTSAGYPWWGGFYWPFYFGWGPYYHGWGFHHGFDHGFVGFRGGFRGGFAPRAGFAGHIGGFRSGGFGGGFHGGGFGGGFHGGGSSHGGGGGGGHR